VISFSEGDTLDEEAGEKVEDIKKGEDGVFVVVTVNTQYRALAVILALSRGRRTAEARRQGEDLLTVMYRLIEADHYINKKVLVVGGGDSAVEAALGLACQSGNQVTLSYGSERFSRIKSEHESASKTSCTPES